VLKIPQLPVSKDFVGKKRRDSDGVPSTNGQVKDGVEQPVRRTARSEEVVGSLPQTVDDDGFVVRHSHMKYELRDSPGLGKDNDSK
jgi:nucleobase transporter 1/2